MPPSKTDAEQVVENLIEKIEKDAKEGGEVDDGGTSTASAASSNHNDEST